MGDLKDGCTDHLYLDNSEAVIDCFRWFCARMGSPTDFFDATVNIYLCIWWNWLTPPITFSFFNWPLISLFQLMGISWGFWGYFRIFLPTSLDENLCEPVHIFRGFKGDLKMVGLNGINENYDDHYPWRWFILAMQSKNCICFYVHTTDLLWRIIILWYSHILMFLYYPWHFDFPV